jgi:hypothetical protein
MVARSSNGYHYRRKDPPRRFRMLRLILIVMLVFAVLLVARLVRGVPPKE